MRNFALLDLLSTWCEFMCSQANRSELRLLLSSSMVKLPITDASKLAKFQALMVPNHRHIDEEFVEHMLRLIAKKQAWLLFLILHPTQFSWLTRSLQPLCVSIPCDWANLVLSLGDY